MSAYEPHSREYKRPLVVNTKSSMQFGYTLMSQVTNASPLTSLRIWDWDKKTDHSCA